MAKRKKLGSPENSAANGDYVVGKGRPPVQSRWKPGQSGNPKGRPKGRRNVKSELSDIASQKITVRDGDKERHLSLLAANFLAHAIKGAKGDARSSNLVFNLAEKMKLVTPEEIAEPAGASSVEQNAGAAKSRPTDGLFENLELSLLSREELAELSRLSELIDLGADLTGLERLKYLVAKGRGSSITETSFPQQPEN